MDRSAILACVIALTFAGVGIFLLELQVHALGTLVLTQQNALTKLNAPMRDPTPAQWARMAAESKAWSEAKDRETDAIRKCREMGQVAALGSGTEAGPTIVCLQAPAVAFHLDPEWPR